MGSNRNKITIIKLCQFWLLKHQSPTYKVVVKLMGSLWSSCNEWFLDLYHKHTLIFRFHLAYVCLQAHVQQPHLPHTIFSRQLVWAIKLLTYNHMWSYIKLHMILWSQKKRGVNSWAIFLCYIVKNILSLSPHITFSINLSNCYNMFPFFLFSLSSLCGQIMLTTYFFSNVCNNLCIKCKIFHNIFITYLGCSMYFLLS